MQVLKATLTVVVAVVLVTGGVKSDMTFNIDLQKHLQRLAEDRYPIERYQSNRVNVKNYIKDRMRYYGLRVEEQTFNTTVNSDPRGIDDEQINVEGTNVIGVHHAKTKFPGAVIVVGADYDTNGVDDPIFRNGAGVAALLEVSRLYTINEAWSGRYAANFTTVFVAFDINTKLHSGSPGHPGGYHFVREWLWKFLGEDATNFGGAIIFDSILNVNYTDNSQRLSNKFENLFPDSYARLNQDSSKGSFLAMVSMGNKDETTKLRDQFSGNYYKGRKNERFRLEDMKLTSGVAFEDTMVQSFTKTESIHFWSFKPNEESSMQTLPTLLLTDTASFRDEPFCPSVPCRPTDKVTEERLEFLNATVKATTRFLFSRQATRLPDTGGKTTDPGDGDSGVSFVPSTLMTLIMFILVRLLY